MIQAHFYYKNALVAIKSFSLEFTEKNKSQIIDWAMEKKLGVENFDRVVCLPEIDRAIYKPL